MSYAHERALVEELVPLVIAAGYRSFVAEKGHYGFFTDAEGSRVVTFGVYYLGLEFSGNYSSQNCGTGWRLGDVGALDKGALDALFAGAGRPPRWATQGEAVTVRTLAQYLDVYQKSSIFAERFA